MTNQEKIIAALTPGSVLNPKKFKYRSLTSLAKCTGLDEDEVMEVILTDLSDLCAYSQNNKNPEKGPLFRLAKPQEEVVNNAGDE